MSWDVSKYLYWFMFIHLWKDRVLAFIEGECNVRVEFVNLSGTNVAKDRHGRLLFVLRCLAHLRHTLIGPSIKRWRCFVYESVSICINLFYCL